ncbi:MAG TPA: 6-phosphogluconolactonase [Thermodesulfobacteriota bacterium]
MAGRRLIVFDDSAALARAAADSFVESFHAALGEKGFFIAVLSGGGTPIELYKLIASPEYSGKIDWASTHLLWGDERCVSPEDGLSNFKSAFETLISRVDIPQQNVHRIRGELPPHEAASEYGEEIRALLGLGPDGLPGFDLVLLGLGADGHTLSVFPDTGASASPKGLVMANYVPKLRSWRVTMTLEAISRAKKTLFLVAGKEKADALKGMLKGDYPAGAVQGEEVLVLADKEAAGFI